MSFFTLRREKKQKGVPNKASSTPNLNKITKDLSPETLRVEDGRRPSLSTDSTKNFKPSSSTSSIRSLMGFLTIGRKTKSANKITQSTSFVNMKLGDQWGSEDRSLSNIEEQRRLGLSLNEIETDSVSSISSSENSLRLVIKNNRAFLSKEPRSGSRNAADEDFDQKSGDSPMDELRFRGIKKFNINPKNGIDFIVKNKFIEYTPPDVAQFLKYGEGLSKTQIGNYLGEHEDFNEKVLEAFVKLHEFKEINLVQALRQFLLSFRLPGESQKIDRMMEAFAKRYCELNPNLFTNTDTCYILSFAIIMLNTTLHNPSVKNKTTLEQFMSMSRDIDGGKSLNGQFLISLYNSIQAEPFKIPPEEEIDMLTFFNPDIEGWLYKQGDRYKKWKRRWFILNNNCIYYFRFTTDKVPRGIIPLENIVTYSQSSIGKYYPFCLKKDPSASNVMEYIKSCKTLSDGSTVPGKHSVINLAAGDEVERVRWMKAIEQNNSISQFYTILNEKKRKIQQQTATGMLPRRNYGKPSIVSIPVRKSQIGVPLSRPEVEIPANVNKNLLFVNKDICPYSNQNNIGRKMSTESANDSQSLKFLPVKKHLNKKAKSCTTLNVDQPSNSFFAQRRESEVSEDEKSDDLCKWELNGKTPICPTNSRDEEMAGMPKINLIAYESSFLSPNSSSNPSHNKLDECLNMTKLESQLDN